MIRKKLKGLESTHNSAQKIFTLRITTIFPSELVSVEKQHKQKRGEKKNQCVKWVVNFGTPGICHSPWLQQFTTILQDPLMWLGSSQQAVVYALL